MRTLLTQVRLKRLIRQHSELVDHLAAEAGGPRSATAAAATSRRLLAAARDVRAAWVTDLRAAGFEPAGLRRHVSRTLASLEAQLAGLAVPAADLPRLTADFREIAVPLMFFLRGLEQSDDRALLAWLEPQRLDRTA